MDISFADNWEYIPEWNNNKNEATPIIFYMNYLTASEKSKCLKEEYFTDDSGQTRVRIIPDRDKFFRFAVSKIDNLKINGKTISNANDFLAIKRIGKLFDEVVTQIIIKESRGEDELKNLP